MFSLTLLICSTGQKHSPIDTSNERILRPMMTNLKRTHLWTVNPFKNSFIRLNNHGELSSKCLFKVGSTDDQFCSSI
ncbi:hypothetical protein Q1695_000451 [Nippostrongylus brasiliensis]|nr:hypothetical protein Q1695_000451 [Nippostrongylus brasiliensis]